MTPVMKGMKYIPHPVFTEGKLERFFCSVVLLNFNMGSDFITIHMTKVYEYNLMVLVQKHED